MGKVAAGGHEECTELPMTTPAPRTTCQLAVSCPRCPSQLALNQLSCILIFKTVLGCKRAFQVMAAYGVEDGLLTRSLRGFSISLVHKITTRLNTEKQSAELLMRS